MARIDNAVLEMENNVYIGSGVKTFGYIVIVDNIAIRVNEVVNHSFEETDISIEGILT